MASIWQQNGQRASFTSRISTLFERRRAQSQDVESARATTTFEVPLFLSPTRYQQPQASEGEHSNESSRPHSSTQSLIETATSTMAGVRPLNVASSSCYSSPAPSPRLYQPPALPVHEVPAVGIRHIQPIQSVNSRIVKDAPGRRRRRRKSSARHKIQSLSRLSAAFGATLLLTLITYVVLAVTGTAVGIMFHVLMILLILALTGVCAHSAIRIFMLSTNAKERRSERRRIDHWHGQAETQQRSYFGEILCEGVAQHEEPLPEKPFRVVMAEDEVADVDVRSDGQTVRQPPPVYGNFRSSKRINPGLVHWHKVPPSPLTPTYDEAMSDVHRAVGYRPPSYVESENGTRYIVEHSQEGNDQARKHVHPLERQGGMI